MGEDCSMLFSDQSLFGINDAEGSSEDQGDNVLSDWELGIYVGGDYQLNFRIAQYIDNEYNRQIYAEG